MSHYNNFAGRRIGRVEALSDGVFAIAMTILVFDLKDPASNLLASDPEIRAALYGMMPKFLTYILSFMTLGIFWTGQSTQYDYIVRYDRNLNWMALFFLMFASLLPFSTVILGNHIHSKFAVGLYWLNILALGVLIFLHWQYACRKNYLSVDGDAKRMVHEAVTRRILVAQSLYALGCALCFISTYLSIAFIIAVQLNYALGIFPKNKPA